MPQPPGPRGVVIAAPSSGAGKTTVTLALLRALRDAGHRVAGGKCGPDYIDPAFHAAACGVPSLTYDAWAMTPAALRHQAYGSEAELLVIEGAMGVLDGAGAASMGSAAQTAEILGLPLVLVIDVAKTGASAVLPVAGLRALHPEVPLAGVILNRVASPRHARILEHAFAGLGVPILGQLPRDPDLTLPERHLGLVQASEHPALEAFLARVGGVLARNADVVAIAAACLPVKAGTKPALLPPLGQRIAVASDTAFAFAYPHILEGWRSQGAEVLPFSPLANAAPDPRADAIFLPGGYPELHAGTLAAAARFRSAMKTTQARIYGECGGYMTLGEGLIDAQGTRHRMLGLLPLETSFERRKRTLGYRRLTPGPGAPWTMPLNAHEFHYATILSEPENTRRLFQAQDADGTKLPDMGLSDGRVSGSFAHVIALNQA